MCCGNGNGNGIGSFLTLVLILVLVFGAGGMYLYKALEEMQATVNQLTIENEQLKKALQTAAGQSEQLTTQINELKQLIANLTKEKEALSKQLDAQNTSYTELQGQSQLMQEAKNQLDTLVLDLQARLADLEVQRQAALDKAGQLANQLKTAQQKSTPAQTPPSSPLVTILALTGIGLTTRPMWLRKPQAAKQPLQPRHNLNDNKMKIIMDPATYERFQEFIKTR
jgi:DNA repair exonuclease SbcCD ATPase subunit